MPKNWTFNTLEELSERVCVGFVGTCHKFYREKGIGVPMIRTTNLSSRGLDLSDVQYIDLEFHLKQKKSQLKKGDILIARHGTNGQACLYNLEEEANCLNVVIVRPNQDITDYKWLLYAINSPIFRNQVDAHSTGSVQKVVNTTALAIFSINTPPLQEQRAISSIISLIDDKIELNLQMNKTLEDIAMALYKHWFVDLGPFQDGEFINSELGMIPKGWEVKRLDEIAHKKSDTFNFSDKEEVVFVNTGDVLEGRFLHSDKISKEGLPGQAKKAIAKDDILYSEIRPKNKRYAYVNFDSSDYVVSTKFMIINPKANILNKLLYRILTMQSSVDNFNSIAEGRSGTFPQITFDAISEMEIVLPPLKVQQEFQNIVSPMEMQQDELYAENQTLTTLRDTLLPKLISGEVRVKEAAEILEEAI